MAKQVIIVEDIYEPREGKSQDHKTLLLKCETERANSTSLVLNKLLGDGESKEKRVAFQTIKAENISVLKIVKGQPFPLDGVRLTISELTLQEFQALAQKDRVGYQMKRNNSEDMKILIKDGQPILRRVSLTADTEVDKTVSHNGMVESDEFDEAEIRKIAAVKAEVSDVVA